MLERLDERGNERISGRSWEAMRPLLEKLHLQLTSPSLTATGALTTIYIKYTSAETGPQPFAVLWVKKASEIVLGLALPHSYDGLKAYTIQTSLKYTGLTAYIKFQVGDDLPNAVRTAINAAYQHLRQQMRGDH